MANLQALLSSTSQPLPEFPEPVGLANSPAGVADPPPVLPSGSVSSAVVSAAAASPASPATASSVTFTASPAPSATFSGWAQAPIILAAVLGGALLIALALLGCFAIRRRRQWRKRNQDNPSMSEAERLISRNSMDTIIPPKYDKRFDLENPAPVYLGKNQGHGHLKALHLLSRSISSTSSSSTLTNGSNNGKRAYSIQPPIPTVSVTYDNTTSMEKSTGSKQAPFEHRTSLPDGFESFIYSLRSPQVIEGTIAKRLSLVSNISTIRFARDSHGWAARRGSTGSFATVFDDDAQKEASPPLTLAKDSRRVSQKPRIRPIPSAGETPQYEDIVEEIQYQPTPLAPPPVQIRARSVTPTNFVVRRSPSIESADTLVGNVSRNGKPVTQDIPSAHLRPGTSILHSAVVKGKISRQDAESALGMRIALTP